MYATKYKKTRFKSGSWVITEEGHEWDEPKKACTFAFDTETFALLDGKIQSQKAMLEALRGVDQEEKRRRLSTEVWAWQTYDDVNGFFMTNDFEKWLVYQCRAGYKFGWCYNAKFDFSQIDYKILAEGKDKWTPHVAKDGKAYNKGQPWTYESIHNDMGARYAYKLWIPYRKSTKHGKDSHKYTHAVEYRDFMNIFPGGLKKTLESLHVVDNEGNDVRKLEMDYQDVDTENLTEAEIDYCCNDVKGLFFAIRIFNKSIEEQSNGECHIFGKETNVMTAGGFAKSELLRSLYPNEKTKKKRIKRFQKEHPLSAVQDKWIRKNHLYRGGISFVNPHFKGKLLTAQQMGRKMNRYDVNSEYPFAMATIYDLKGAPEVMDFSEWLKKPKEWREKYECIYMLTSVQGHVKRGFLGFWYNPFRNDFVEDVDEQGLHLMFEREFNELCEWYDLDFTCEKCLILKRGKKVFAPFVNENYALKAQAKKDGNAGLSGTTKLKLNSSYGKLAERIERIVGHYELNEDTGAIHFVQDKVEVDESASMNVILGALVTATARVWIMSHIREICGGANMANCFVYIDTDSIHAFASYDKADPFTLGGFKLEAECEAVKYIAPKTYVDIEHVHEDGSVDVKDIEAHTKGINVSAVSVDMAKQERLTLEYIDRRFNYGEQFVVLCAMNVKGGKVLVPTEKYLARPELAPNENINICYGYDGNIISEV